MIPEEDEWLIKEQHKIVQCKHEYVDFYLGSGISKKDKDIMNIPVFCKKCLDKKWLHIDISDNDYGDDYE
jgi:hypothetical protein